MPGSSNSSFFNIVQPSAVKEINKYVNAGSRQVLTCVQQGRKAIFSVIVTAVHDEYLAPCKQLAPAAVCGSFCAPWGASGLGSFV